MDEWRWRRSGRPTEIVAVAESAVPHVFVTLTQKLAVELKGGVVNVFASPPTGIEVSPALPSYHW